MKLNLHLLVLSAQLALATAYPSYSSVNDDKAGTAGSGLRKAPCPYSTGFAAELSDELAESRRRQRRLGAEEDGHSSQPFNRNDPRSLQDGLLNEGKGCWGFCDSTAGNCAYCGTGQCCRSTDYQNGVPGCELAYQIVSGSRCGAWAGDPPIGLRNEGLACSGKCPDGFGADCAFCGGWDGIPNGSGQCCRVVDGERGVPGCELAAWGLPDPEGPSSQCGAYKDLNESNDEPSPPNPPSTNPPAPSPVLDTNGDLMNEGFLCEAACGFSGDQWGQDRSCPQYCGALGLCCSAFDWRRGAAGCEWAENVTGAAICGMLNEDESSWQEPDDFRPGMPRGVYTTPLDASVNFESVAEGRWIKDIVADGSNVEDHHLPQYSGEGGQPWSLFEMAVVRDILTFEMRQATGEYATYYDRCRMHVMI